jgi:undecaprenyl-diphosphatase
VDLVRAAILGIVQGLTEFLPVSSSGHLILVPALFRWPDQGLAFDVGLHLGTLLALVVYFWRDWLLMLSTAIVDLGRHRLRFAAHRPESRLLWKIVVATIPAAVVGLLFNGWIEDNVREAWIVAIALAGMGTVMLVAERTARGGSTLYGVKLGDALIIGVAQAIALIPGVSRSGATMSAGLWRGFDRNDAARFAFLLGMPAFLGAALVEASDLASVSGREALELAIGFACSAVVGYLAIRTLMRYLRTRTLLPFVLYRYGVAALTLVIAGIRVA